MFRGALFTALLALAGAASHAGSNCDTLREQIDAKVRASGVSNFTLQVVDAQAKVAGKVVGSCELGTRKIVYSQGPAAAASTARPRDGKILTECRDGSVTYGDCKP
ncbi:DUF1161 domain-containing protein [Piscinibacter defluvii]|uniref:DUF1161 domain-containing protein n=1 Tax=Piscinibacter defluvii TaxID=1796922 RepID=UPI000FDD5FC1|nr:DUF1161 domain-containing protein [Piscinibacter defluvii]